MTQEHLVVSKLDREDRRQTLVERLLIAMILVIGIVLAALIRFEISSEGQDIHSITCEGGDVTLILERSDGTFERVQCPVDVTATP